ncbi:MAG: hypothetical protein HY684_04790 [Chloroflexi bacterium]|nr:hypothetical protein [Chloroflexota bacterium]
MRTTRVVLLTNRSLLSAGVGRLLQAIQGVELVIVAGDDPDAGGKIRQVAPQVIILDSCDASLGEEPILRILDQYPRAKVIALNLNHHGIDVYQMRRLKQANLDGLLAAIQGAATPNKAQRLPKAGNINHTERGVRLESHQHRPEREEGITHP